MKPFDASGGGEQCDDRDVEDGQAVGDGRHTKPSDRSGGTGHLGPVFPGLAFHDSKRPVTNQLIVAKKSMYPATTAAPASTARATETRVMRFLARRRKAQLQTRTARRTAPSPRRATFAAALPAIM